MEIIIVIVTLPFGLEQFGLETCRRAHVESLTAERLRAERRPDYPDPSTGPCFKGIKQKKISPCSIPHLVSQENLVFSVSDFSYCIPAQFEAELC